MVDEHKILNQYKEILDYITNNIYIINEKDKNKNNARKIGVCTDCLNISYYVIKDFFTSGFQGTEYKAFITLYALAHAIDISIQATVKLSEIVTKTVCNRKEIVSTELQEFIDEILNNIKKIDEFDSSIILNSIDNRKYEVLITSLKNNNFKNKKVLYRKLIIEYLTSQSQLLFVKHIISKIIMNDTEKGNKNA